MGWRYNSRNARHPFNAMLNYGYGILASQMRKQVVAAGLDPGIGVMHGNKDNRVPLVYDLMEPLRPVTDRAILEFALSHEFVPGDFTINKWGGCRLNPQLATRLTGGIVLGDEPNAVVQKFRATISR
jgi:CRISPR-associated protein Cas1